VRRMIIEDIDTGHTPNEISQRLRVSTTFISELRKTRDAFGTVQPTPWMRLGPAPKITTVAAEGMLDLLDQDPQATLAEFVNLLDSEYDIKVSLVTVSRRLKEIRITHKRVERTNQA
jgi:transposase